MKQFNLDEYLANPTKKLITRDGREVKRILCTDVKGKYPIVAVIGSHVGNIEKAISFTKDGKCFDCSSDNEDIFFAPEKHEGWVNVFEDICGDRGVGPRIFNSKEYAEKEAKNFNGYITTIKIEWEE